MSEPKPSAMAKIVAREDSESDRVLVKRKTLQAVLRQCQQALELLESNNGAFADDDEDEADDEAGVSGGDGDGISGEDRRGGEADQVRMVRLLLLWFLLLF